jgi:GTP-binding protein HflX
MDLHLTPATAQGAHPTGDGSRRKTAVVLKAVLKREPALEEPLAEIGELARTAGVTVVDSFLQKLDRRHPATYLGKGKIEEAARRAAEVDADFVVVDNDLSPAQERNLEKLCERTVIDRSQLIMDVFAQHARSHQAKMQVELAQLRYTRPRLKRLWTHLSRYEGGIGMRGPGETQLETDKRIISRRIQKLVKELEDIEERKETSLTHRDREFLVAIVGYTNTGKSTLLNALTGADELVEDKLFATLDTRVRRWELAKNRHVLLTDTVGFIRDLPHHLVASFHATLAETRHADLLLHVVDASSPDAAAQVEIVNKVLEKLGCHEKPCWLVLNKWDAVPPERTVEARVLHSLAQRGHAGAAAVVAVVAEAAEDAAPRSLEVSARFGHGLERLREGVLDHVQRQEAALTIEVPHNRPEVISFLREHARIVATEYSNEGARVRFSISPAREARLRRLFPEGFRDGEGGEA